jgi:hypothetical protein
MLTHNFSHRMTGKPSKALLMASLGTACCLLTPWAIAVNYVTNCADQGTGSLRQAIANAPENGVVDATGLANVCSVITVKTGDIQVAVNDLTILGPGADALEITALYIGKRGFHHYYSRIFNHTGTGTLTLENLSVTDGLIKPTGNQGGSGGCIYSKGNVSLMQSTVSGCTVYSTLSAGGGGIEAIGKVYLLNSQVIDNKVSAADGAVVGGAIESNGFEGHSAVISGNTVTRSGNNYLRGGGLFAYGIIDIESTTISGNTVSGAQHGSGGGVKVGGTMTIRNSTISGNSASGGVGGILVTIGKSLTLLNSTIAFNHSGQDNAPGAWITATNLDFESNILANNTWGSTGPATIYRHQSAVR